MRDRQSDRRIMLCAFAVMNEWDQFLKVYCMSRWIHWYQKRRRWLELRRNKSIERISALLQLTFTAWKEAAVQKGALKRPGDEDLVDYELDIAASKEQLFFEEQFTPPIQKILQSAVASDRLLREHGSAYHSSPSAYQCKLDAAVYSMDVASAADAIARGAAVELHHIRYACASINADHAPLFALLLSRSPVYCARLIIGDCMEEELNRCASPLIVIILKNHIERWSAGEMTRREMRSLVLCAEPVLASTELSIALWRDVVRWTLLQTKRNNSEATTAKHQLLDSYILFDTRSTVDLHASLQRPYIDRPVADVTSQLVALQEQTEVLYALSAEERRMSKERTYLFGRRKTHLENRLAFINLKEMKAEKEGRLTAEERAKFKSEREAVYANARTPEESILTQCEDLEDRVVNNFSQMFVETCVHRATKTEVERTMLYNAKLWIMMANRAFSRLVGYVMKAYTFTLAETVEEAVNMRSGVIANWLLCSMTQQRVSREFQRHSAEGNLWSCFPTNWWSRARLHASLEAELRSSQKLRFTSSKELQEKSSSIDELFNSIHELKEFTKRVQKEVGTIGKKSRIKSQKENLVLNGLKVNIGKVTKTLSQATQSKQSIVDKIEVLEALMREEKFEEVLSAAGESVDDDTKGSMKKYEYRKFCKAAAQKCIDELHRKRLNSADALISITSRHRKANDDLAVQERKYLRTSDMLRALAREKFNGFIDGREMIARLELQLKDLTNEVAGLQSRSAVLQSYETSIRKTMAFITDQAPVEFVTTSEESKKSSVLAAMRSTSLKKNGVASTDQKVADGAIGNTKGRAAFETITEGSDDHWDELGSCDSDEANRRLSELNDADLLALQTAKLRLRADSEDDVEEDFTRLDTDEKDPLTFGSKRLVSSTTVSTLDLPPDSMLRDMVFNEYWNLVGGSQMRTPGTAPGHISLLQMAPLVSQKEPLPDDIVENSSRAIKPELDKEDAAISSDEYEDLETPDMAIDFCRSVEGSDELLPSSWYNDAADGTLISVSMSLDTEGEPVEAASPSPTRQKFEAGSPKKRSRLRSGMLCCFSLIVRYRLPLHFIGMNFQKGDPFVQAGLAQLARRRLEHLMDQTVVLEEEEEEIFLELPYRTSDDNRLLPLHQKISPQLEDPVDDAANDDSLEEGDLQMCPDLLEEENNSFDLEPDHIAMTTEPTLEHIEAAVDEESFIRSLLAEDAKEAAVEDMDILIDRPPSTMTLEDSLPSAIQVASKNKSKLFKEGLETATASPLKRKLRRLNPLRKSQSVTEQINQFSLLDTIALPPMPADFYEPGLYIQTLDGAPHLSGIKDVIALADANDIKGENSPPLPELEMGASEESNRHLRFVNRVESAPRAVYPSLDILVRAESRRSALCVSPFESIDAVKPPEGSLDLSDAVLNFCIGNVKQRIERIKDPEPPRRPLMMRSATSIALLSSFNKGRVPPCVEGPRKVVLAPIVKGEGALPHSAKEHITAAPDRKVKAARPSLVPLRKAPEQRLLMTSSRGESSPVFSVAAEQMDMNVQPAVQERIKAKEALKVSNVADLIAEDSIPSALGFAYAVLLNLHKSEPSLEVDDTSLDAAEEDDFDDHSPPSTEPSGHKVPISVVATPLSTSSPDASVAFTESSESRADREEADDAELRALYRSIIAERKLQPAGLSFLHGPGGFPNGRKKVGRGRIGAAKNVSLSLDGGTFLRSKKQFY